MAHIYDLPDEILQQLCVAMSPSARLMMELTSVKLRDNIRKLPRIAKDTVIEDAVHSGFLEVITFLHTVEKFPLTRELFSECVVAGYIPVVQWLLSVNCPKWADICEIAALHNHFELLVILHQYHTTISTLEHLYAAANGNTHMMEWLQNMHPFANASMLLPNAAKHQHMIDWIHTTIGYARDYTEVCNRAAREGYLDMLKYIIADGYQWDPLEIVDNAVRSGELSVVEYVHRIGGQLSGYAYHIATYRGFLDILKWLCLHNCPKRRDTCHTAYVARQLHILEWIAENPTECTCMRTHSRANGHTKLMNKLKHDR